MTMLHRAYLFDSARFDKELRPLLEAALQTNAVEPIVGFIRERRATLTDPNEGATLGDDWESAVQVKDVHQYGDFALTGYYDVKDDRGLADLWPYVRETLQHVVGTDTLMLGTTLGPRTNLFNPGKRGSFFQTSTEVGRNLLLLKNALRQTPSAGELLHPLETLLKDAAAAKRGLYVTF